MGIEPMYSPWKGDILPLNYRCYVFLNTIMLELFFGLFKRTSNQYVPVSPILNYINGIQNHQMPILAAFHMQHEVYHVY